MTIRIWWLFLSNLRTRWSEWRGDDRLPVEHKKAVWS